MTVTQEELIAALTDIRTDAENGSRLYQDPPADVVLRNGDMVPNLRKRLAAVTDAADQLGAISDAVDQAQAWADEAKEAAAAASSISFQDPIRFNIVPGQAEYDIGINPGRDRCQVTIGIASLIYDIHYEFDEDSPQILRLLMPELYAVPAVAAIRGTPDRPYDPNLNRGEFFASWSLLVEHIAAHGARPGQQYIIPTAAFFAPPVGHVRFGLDLIADLPGLFPAGNLFDPAHWGADYRGIDDVTAAMQACVDAAAVVGFPVVTGPGTLKWNGTVTPTHHNQYFDFGNTILDGTEFTGWTGTSTDWNTGRNRGMLEPRGEMVRNDLLLAADGVEGNVTITLDDASDVKPGDIVTLLSSGQLWYTNDDGTPLTRKEMNRVVSVSGDDVVLAHPLSMDYDATGYSVAVRVVRPVRNVYVVGGHWLGGGLRDGLTTNGFGPCGFSPEGVDGLIFRPVSMTGFQNKAFAAYIIMNWEFSGATIRGFEDDYTDPVVEGVNSGFYCMFPSWARFGKVFNITARRVRHLLDGSNSWDLGAYGNTPINCHQSAYTTHSGGSDWTIDLGHERDARKYSVNWRGFNLTMIGGEFDNRSDLLGNYGINIAKGGDNDMYRRLSFRNIRGKADNPCLQVSARNIDLLEIIDCDFECADQSPVRIMSPRFKNLRVRGGRFKTKNANRSIHLYAFGDNASLQNTGATVDIQGATLEGYLANPIDIGDTATAHNVIVKGNTLVPGVGAETSATVVYANRANGIWDVGPNYRGQYFVDSGPFWFTPQLRVGGSSTGITTTTANGWGDRQRSTVVFNIQLALTSKGVETGAVAIIGLPLEASTPLGNSPVEMVISNVSSSLDTLQLSAHIQGNTGEIRLYKRTGGATTQLTEADITNTTTIRIGGTYRIRDVTS